MSDVRIESVLEPFLSRPKASMAAAQLLYRAEYLGVLGEDLLRGPLTGGRVTALVQALADLGVASSAAMQLLGALTRPATGRGAVTDDRLAALLSSVREQVGDSPLPDTEWAPLRASLGDDLLARLVDVSATSLRRYTDGARETPDDVASRLHAVAMITADLAGGYNDRGMRRWFTRPRVQLDGRSPVEVLEGGFDPDGEDAALVSELAAWLSGAGSAA